MSSIRVTARKNGDYSDGGKALVFPQSTDFGLPELFVKATTKLSPKVEEGKEPDEFKRVFLGDAGAEVTDMEEIMDGDKLFFSCGEAFIPQSASPVERRHILETIARVAAEQTIQRYSQASTYIKDNSPAIVGNTMTKVEEKAAPLVSKLLENFGTPVLTWADGHLDQAYATMASKREEFLQSEYATMVNDNLFKPSEAFYSRLINIWKSLNERTAAKAATLSEFLAATKQRLGDEWNEKLVEPAKGFYAAVTQELSALTVDPNQEEATTDGDENADATTDKKSTAAILEIVFRNVKSRLGTAWEDKVKVAIDEKVAAIRQKRDSIDAAVRSRAEAFSKLALESWASLDQSGDGKVTWEEFQAGMRVKLGGLWNEKLLPPAKHLYEQFKQAKLASLIPSRSFADVNNTETPAATEGSDE